MGTRMDADWAGCSRIGVAQEFHADPLWLDHQKVGDYPKFPCVNLLSREIQTDNKVCVEMKLKLRWFFYLMVVVAVCSVGYRQYQRLPPTHHEYQRNESRADRQNEYPRYYRMAISQYGEPAFGYYVRFTNKDAYSETDNRVATEKGQLFLDGRLILPQKGKFLVLIREDLKTPQLVELDQREIARFMDFTAGDRYFDEWKQLWLDLAAKAGSQGKHRTTR